MIKEWLTSQLLAYQEKYPLEREIVERIISWIDQHKEFAFVKENLDGHITASLFITNPERTRVFLMYHKKYWEWCQFWWHCDGEMDTLNVAVREFHEESGISEEPEIFGDIFSVQLWEVAERTSSSGMFQPRHTHFDVLYLWVAQEYFRFSPCESEVDDLRWFDIRWIEKYVINQQTLDMIGKIKSF